MSDRETQPLTGRGTARFVPIRLDAFVEGRKVGSIVVERGSASIGSAEGNNLVIDHPTVSRKHVELHVRPSSVFVRDLGSKNGTRYQGSQVQEVQVPVGASLLLGEAEVRVEDASAPEPKGLGPLESVAPAMLQAIELLRTASGTQSAVLLEGETGVGKEVAARALHDASPRKAGPFVTVDCGGTRAAAELFGQDRPGALENATAGTLFLNDVSSFPADQQPFLLRCLETRRVQRIGASESAPFDVRVVAATNHDLDAEVQSGRMRADLFHVLAVVRVRIPPLRERRADLPLLIRAILASFGARAAGFNMPPDTALKLSAYAWPGNIRELRNVIERTVTLAGDGPIDPKALEAAAAGAGAQLDYKDARDRALLAFERDYLVHLLRQSGHNVSQAARMAGIDRVYLHRLIKKHGLSVDDV
jgi:DNA-binding NtrC family response regulator